MSTPLCFVLMPFGKKTDSSGLTVDFDAVYGGIVRSAIVDAGLEPLRADEDVSGGGIIHKAMFERLLLCRFAVADLTTANANVFYQLGVRHAVRRASTVLLFAEGARLPFDVGFLRALSYRLGPDGRVTNESEVRASLRDRLTVEREAGQSQFVDSPVFALLERFPEVQNEKTDIFRAQVENSLRWKQELAVARREGVEALRTIEQRLLPQIDGVESSVLIDLFLSYRSVRAWDRMISLAGKLPDPLAATTVVREQLAFALNRAGRAEDSERLLRDILATSGPSSETYGLLGRVYKDRWEAASTSGNRFLAEGLLRQAIEAYVKGFDIDFHEAYAGVNAVTLMELRDPPDPRRLEMIPIVTYSLKRRIEKGQADYWDYATLLELAVLAKDRTAASDALSSALARIRTPWEPETTARNLRLITQKRAERNEEEPAWAVDLIASLNARAM